MAVLSIPVISTRSGIPRGKNSVLFDFPFACQSFMIEIHATLAILYRLLVLMKKTNESVNRGLRFFLLFSSCRSVLHSRS